MKAPGCVVSRLANPAKKKSKGAEAPRSRATDPRTGGRPSQGTAGTNPRTGQAQLYFCNFERLICLCIAFEGDLSEVASAVGGTSLASWFMAVVRLPHRSCVLPQGRRPGQPSSTSLARRACVHRSTVMVIDSCVSEVNCGTLEKVPSVGFAAFQRRRGKRASVCEYGELRLRL